MSTIQLKSAERQYSPNVHAGHLDCPADGASRMLADRYQSLLANLRRPLGDGAPRPALIGVVSCRQGEGASTVASNLAIVAQSIGLCVALVDGDRFSPSINRTFELPLSPGLVDCLTGSASLADCLHPSSSENLTILPAGPSNRSEAVFESETLAGTFGTLRGQFDLVLVDLPPLDRQGDASAMARYLDGVLLVVATDGVGAPEVRHSLAHLSDGGAVILGAVLNDYR